MKQSIAMVFLVAVCSCLCACGDTKESIKADMEEAQKVGFFTQEQIAKKQNIDFWKEEIAKIDGLRKDKPDDKDLQKMRLDAGLQLSKAEGENALGEVAGTVVKAVGTATDAIATVTSDQFAESERGVRDMREAREADARDHDPTATIYSLQPSTFKLSASDTVIIAWDWLFVRQDPGLKSRLVTKLSRGIQGIVAADDPVDTDGHRWVHVVFDYNGTSYDGWCAQDGLKLKP